MENISLYKLKTKFRSTFPEYSKLLDNAKTQDDIDALRERFITESKANLQTAMQKAGIGKSNNEDAAILLTPEIYEKLINARGDTIVTQLHILLDGLERLGGMEDDNAGLVTVQILVVGILAIGLVSTTFVCGVLMGVTGAVAAAFAGVVAATVSVVCALATLVVVMIIMPLIYFMIKPANCIVLLINELDKPLIFDSDYNVHGKPSLMTTPLPPSLETPRYEIFMAAGLIASEKCKNALVGTQYGFVMKYGNTKLAFGVESPLSSIYVDNNCYCEIDASAKSVATTTTDKNATAWDDEKDGIKISIKCNSGSGSIAYYIARAYKV